MVEECTESHQTSNEMLGEQSRSQVGTALPTAMGPCAPSEPLPHSSGFVATSEHAVISGWSAGSFSPVQSIPRAVATYTSMPRVFFSSGLAFTNEHAVEAAIPGFSAESSAVVQGKSCVDRAVSHGFDVVMSGGSPAHLARSRPGVGTQYAHVGYPGVELVSRATYISRKKRNLETVQRHSKALKKAQRDAKRKFRNQAARTDEKIPGTIHVSHHLALLHGHENVFFCTQCGAVNAGGAFEATEVSVRRIWRIPSESETQA